MHDRLATLGAAMIDEALQGLAGGTLSATPQPAEGVTYAEKIAKAEGHLDWREDAGALERRVRAFTPWPGAFFEVRGEKGGERVKVLAAEVRAERSEEHTSELQSLMRTSYAVFCLQNKTQQPKNQ